MIDIYAVKVRDWEQKEFEKFMEFVPESKRVQIRKFARREDATRALISDLLVKYVIMNRLKIGIGDIRISKNEFGKPYLEGRKDFHFNVSHSNQWVICASGESPVGVDIEYIAPVDPLFVEKFFSEDEFTDIILHDPVNRIDYFYDLWTLKESYIKAVGKGLYIPLDSFSVKIEKNGKILFKSLFDSSRYHFSRYNFNDNYKISICSMEPVHDAKITIKSQESINDEIISRQARYF